MTAKPQALSLDILDTSALPSPASSVVGPQSPPHPKELVYIPDSLRYVDPSNKSAQTTQRGKRNFDCINEELNSTSSSIKDLPNNDSNTLTKIPEPHPTMTEEELYDDDEEDPKIKRKAQNRAAQRAFRERKERYVKELEQKIKEVRDQHVYATNYLYQENQHLRSLIYHLELELYNSKGFPQGTTDFKSVLDAVVPPPLLHRYPPTPPPQPIRPVVIASNPRKIVPITFEPSKKQKTHFNNTTKATPTPINAEPSPAQQYKFSITTPDTLRANSHNELLRKSEQIQMVKLYPDHSHPANGLLNNQKEKYHDGNHSTTATPILSPVVRQNAFINIASSVASDSSFSDEEEKTDQEINDILKPFFDPCTSFDINSFDNSNQGSHWNLT